MNKGLAIAKFHIILLCMYIHTLNINNNDNNNNHLSEPSQMFPSLLAGRTTLVIKKKAKGNIPGNYRLITCLSNVWKVLSSIVHKMIQTLIVI